jgi:hypothetical protein
MHEEVDVADLGLHGPPAHAYAVTSPVRAVHTELRGTGPVSYALTECSGAFSFSTGAGCAGGETGCWRCEM